MGDVHPLGNPHYWLDPENGKVIARAIAAQAVAAPARTTRRTSISGWPTSRSRLDEAQKRWLAAMAPYKGAEGRHLSPLVSELRRPLRARRRRLRRAAAGHSAVAAAHARSDQRDEAAEREADPGRAVLRPEDAELDRPRRPARRCSCCRRRSAASKDDHRLLQAVRLRHQPARRRRQADAGRSRHAWTLARPRVSGGAVRRQPDPDRHPRLPRRARRRARRHLRRPLAGADRGARRDDRAAACRSRAAIAHAPAVYWVSLAFTFIGAVVFSTIRSRRARIPQEAIIGICYAVASAAAILAMSKATSESEHLKDMLVGNILAVSWPEVGIRRRCSTARSASSTTSSASKFLAISMDPSGPRREGMSIRFWDFLFYASFGFVVTSSVAIAGVLLVFCYLIVPSVAAMLYADSHRRAPRHRLDDGHARLGARRVPVARARSADRRDDRLHVRPGCSS